jgi:hypothetical protein
LLRKIHIGTGQIITIPDEMTIREFFTRNPDITLLIPRDLSRLSPIPYPSIITFSLINEVIRPGLINLRDACYVNVFMELLFYILSLRLLIVAWSNRDLIISALHMVSVAMSQDRFIDAVSLSTVYGPDVFDGKDCFELGLQIVGALRDTSSGTLREIIQQLFWSRQITRFSTPFSSRGVSDRHSFF